MSSRSALPFLLIVAASACNAVLGLDEREHASGSTPDDDSSIGDADQDTGVALDTAKPDVVVGDTASSGETPKGDGGTTSDSVPVDVGVDATVSPTCAKLGLKCAAGQSCIVSLTATSTYGYGCEPPPPSGLPGKACYFDGKTYKCQEGYACNLAYPTGTVCVPVCDAEFEDCDAAPTGYSWCGGTTWISSPPGRIAVCHTCDPVNPSVGILAACSLSPATCTIRSSTSPPGCATSSGTRTVGESCGSFGLRCGAGLACDCTKNLGSPACDALAGTCRKVCRTNADCSSAGGTCKPFDVGSSYSLCRP